MNSIEYIIKDSNKTALACNISTGLLMIKKRMFNT